ERPVAECGGSLHCPPLTGERARSQNNKPAGLPRFIEASQRRDTITLHYASPEARSNVPDWAILYNLCRNPAAVSFAQGFASGGEAGCAVGSGIGELFCVRASTF